MYVQYVQKLNWKDIIIYLIPLFGNDIGWGPKAWPYDYSFFKQNVI